MMKHKYIILILLFISANESYAESIDYYDFECTGVLPMLNISTLATWELHFINANIATLNFFVLTCCFLTSIAPLPDSL